MTDEDLLLKEGAWYHCARLIYRNQDVGVKLDGSTLELNDVGTAIVANLANITDVEAKPAKTRAKKITPADTIEDLES